MKKTNVNDIAYHYAELDLALICEDIYKKLTPRDILVFTLLKNQESLSLNSVRKGNHSYVDEDGNIFIRISQEKLSKIMNISEPTLRSSLKVLEKLDLIEVVKLGKNQCSRMYIGTPESTTTYKDYVTKIGLEIEAEKEKEQLKLKNTDIKVTNINKDNKKGSSAPTEKPNNKNNNKFFDTNSISHDKESIQEENNNFQFITDSGIKNIDKATKKQKEDIKKWDFKLLEECVNYMYFNCEEKFNLSYLIKVYNNPIFKNKETKATEAPSQTAGKVVTRFHNINQSFTKYGADELEKRLKESQEGKFK